MLRKLLKYEFKSTYRTYLIVYAVMVALCALTGVLDQVQNLFGGAVTIFTTLMLLYVIFLFAAVVITTVLNLNRFYRGLFKDEGYLIHTLPVHPWQIITAKLLPAVLWTLATGAMMLLSMALVALTSAAMSLDGLVEIFQHALQILAQMDWNEIASILLYAMELLLMLICCILQIYASLTAGQLFARHRVAWSVVIWFVFNTLQSMSSNLVIWLLNGLTGSQFSTNLDILLSNVWGAGCLLRLVWAVVFWAITQTVLSHRLNLE